jgi:hypothetical protein
MRARRMELTRMDFHGDLGHVVLICFSLQAEGIKL